MSVHNRSGFTLMQLMVTLAISGIIAAAVFQMLLGQGQFSRWQNAREETQQDARLALEIITAELRSVAPEGIVTATPGSVSLRTPRAWGVVCEFDAGRLTVLYPAATRGSLRLGEDSLAVPVPAAGADWQFVGVADATGLSGYAETAALTCNARLETNPPTPAPASPADAVARVYQGVPAGLVPGARVYLFDRVGYDVGPTSEPGDWIRRNGHLFAGPMPTDDPAAGLRFAYLDAANAPTANRHDVRSVHVGVTVESRPNAAGSPLRTADSTVVFLRNRN